MKLEAEGQRAIVDPQGNDVQSAVTLLAPPDRTFVILSRSESSYVQARVVDMNRLALECRDGSPTQHFQSARSDYSTGEVIQILESYRRGEDSWWTENEWRRIEVSGRKDPWSRLSGILAVAAIILMFDAAFALKGRGGDPIFGLETLDVLAIGCGAYMASAIIDLRRFRTMTATERVRAIGGIGIGVMVLTIFCIERFTAR
jgi:hypothetical protein